MCSIFFFKGFSVRSYKQLSTKYMTLACVLMQTILPARSLCFNFLHSFSLSNSEIPPPPKKTAKIKPNFSKMKFLRLLDKAGLIK